MRGNSNIFTYVSTTSGLLIPLWIHVSIWDHFPSVCRTFSTISCPLGLLVMNSFYFCISQKSLFCLWFLKVVFLVQNFRLTNFSFSQLKMLLCCFLICIFADKTRHLRLTVRAQGRKGGTVWGKEQIFGEHLFIWSLCRDNLIC